MKRKTKVVCSDWDLGWGYGNNHIGELSFDTETDSYVWRGHRQGRHGHRSKTTQIQWRKDEPVPTISATGGAVFQYPLDSDRLKKAIKELNTLL